MYSQIRIYKYPCMVTLTNENVVGQLYEYLKKYNYKILEPFYSCGKSLANILVTCNSKEKISWNPTWGNVDGYSVLTREDCINKYKYVDCGTDIDLFKKLVIIKNEDKDYDFGNEIVNIKNASLIT